MSELYPEETKIASDYARSPEGKNAGGLVAMGMLGELAMRGATPQVQEAARTLMAEGGLTAEMIPGSQAAQQALVAPATGAAGGIGIPFLQQPAAPAPASVDDLVPQPFPDAPEVLTAPTPSWDDLDLDDEEEPATKARAQAQDDEDDEDDWGDPDVLRAKLAKERKRREHAERERARAMQTKWVEEAVHVFRDFVSDEELAGIEATSRRDYLRQAKAIAERNRAVLQRFGVQPGQNAAQAAPGQTAPPAQETEAQMRERIRAEERARLEQAWGRPMVSSSAPAVSPQDADRARAVSEARRTGNLEKLLRANLFGRG